MVTSGIRLGSPALTSRGMKETEMTAIGNLICDVLDDIENENLQQQVRGKVLELTQRFPLYSSHISHP
jgi:glycine hydroxymethyltransferase